MEIKTEKSINELVIHGFFLSFQSIQSLLALLFWPLTRIALILVILAHKKWGKEGEKKKVAKKLFDISHPVTKKLYAFLRWSLNTHMSLSGITRINSSFDRLLLWNTKYPLYAFIEDKTIDSWEILGDKYPDNTRAWDMVWISRTKKTGKFNIIEKRIEDSTSNVESEIRCIYISGQNIGKVFTLVSRIDLNSSNNSDDITPTHIYLPPRFIIFLLDIILSIVTIFAVILLFITLINQTFELLKNLGYR